MRRYRNYITGVGASFLVRIFAMALAFVVQFVCAWALGASAYGLYSYALAVVSLAVVLVTRGVGQTAVRYVAAAHARGDAAGVTVLRRWATRRILRSAGVVMPLSLLAGFLLSRVNPTFSLRIFAPMLLGLPLVALTLLFAGILAGMKRPAWAEVPESIVKPLTVCGVVLVAWLIVRPVAPEAAAVGYLLGSGFAALVGWVVVRSFTGAQGALVGSPLESVDPSAWERMAHHIFIMTLVKLLLDRFDLFLLGWYVDAASIGVYNVTTRLAQLVGFILVVSNTMMGPMIVQHYQRSDREQLQRLLNFAGRIVCGLTLLVILSVVFWGEWVLSWYGSEFAEGYHALLLLSAGQFMNALFGPVGLLLNMTDRTATAMHIIIASSILCVLLNVTLVPRYGIEGAAVATSCGMGIWNLWMYVVVRRNMKIDSSGLLGCSPGSVV